MIWTVMNLITLFLLQEKVHAAMPDVNVNGIQAQVLAESVFAVTGIMFTIKQKNYEVTVYKKIISGSILIDIYM